MIPKQGDIAACSRGHIGLITCERPAVVTYDDGATGEAWTGIHLSNLHGKGFGSPWCSRDPKVLYNITILLMEALFQELQ